MLIVYFQLCKLHSPPSAALQHTSLQHPVSPSAADDSSELTHGEGGLSDSLMKLSDNVKAELNEGVRVISEGVQVAISEGVRGKKCRAEVACVVQSHLFPLLSRSVPGDLWQSRAGSEGTEEARAAQPGESVRASFISPHPP